MRLKILATAILAVPLWLATPLRAENPLKFTHSPILRSQYLLTQASWNEFSSTQGGFAVSMPGTPKEETQTNQDGSVEHSFSLAVDNTAYLIHYSDIPEAEKLTQEQVKQLLDSAPDDFTKSANAKLLKSENISLSGHPGKEFEFAIGDRVNGKGRVYMVKQRLYIVVGMTSTTDNFQKFLDSFRLL